MAPTHIRTITSPFHSPPSAPPLSTFNGRNPGDGQRLAHRHGCTNSLRFPENFLPVDRWVTSNKGGFKVEILNPGLPGQLIEAFPKDWRKYWLICRGKFCTPPSTTHHSCWKATTILTILQFYSCGQLVKIAFEYLDRNKLTLPCRGQIAIFKLPYRQCRGNDWFNGFFKRTSWTNYIMERYSNCVALWQMNLSLK